MSQTCRTCLVRIRDVTYIKLNDNGEKSRSVRAELLDCVPELHLNLVEAPVICRNCVNVLQLAHSFKTRCLLAEKRIRSCLRSAKLNRKPVTLTKLLRFSKETNTGKHCSRINGSVARDSNDVSSDPTAGERFPAQPGRTSLDIEAANDEHETTDDYITSTKNEDSDVVTSSEVSLVDGEDESDLQNIITTNVIAASIGSTLQPVEFRGNILGWSSAATCTDILGETSRDFHNEIDVDFVKEEHELTFKREADEALSFKEGTSNNHEEERSDDWESVKEETRSITDDADGNNLVDNEGYEFSAATGNGEKFEGSNSTNLDNQIKEYCLNVRKLSTDSNYTWDLYSNSATSSDANITEQYVSNVKKQRVNYEEERTYNYNTSSLCKNSKDEIAQEMSDTDEDSLTKQEHVLGIFKTKEPLNEKKIKDCTVDLGCSIKMCFVNLQRLHLGNLKNKSSFNANELLKFTSAKLLQTTNKKPESGRHNGNKNLSKHKQAHSSKKSFCCKICKYSTAVKRNLVRHLHIHTREKPFQCKVCDHSTVHKQNLIKHMRIHIGEKPFQCKVCEFRAAEKQNLISHMRTHTGEKPFQCNVCDYRAVEKQALIKHIRIHTGEKPFQCNVCEYSAVQKQNLIRHMRTHTGEKPFQCNICEYSASHKHNLINHMRTHTGEKPFQCKVCEYSASQKHNLINHMRTHTGEKPFQCKVCEYRSAEKQNVISHMRIHTGEKPFQCNVCDYRTFYKQTLIRHMRTHTAKKQFCATVARIARSKTIFN